ncbi:hypothetical protein BKA69DRAFT_459677 [Paraphysoderma sedebokerense]|nr:hypothetical protein BKA69DRAFT_459677 [Paraphysoderma sedebokerense]
MSAGITVDLPRTPTKPSFRPANFNSPTKANGYGHPNLRIDIPNKYPRRPYLFQFLRRSLAISTLLLIGTFVGFFLIFASMAMFFSTIVGCLVMLSLEGLFLIVPGIFLLNLLIVTLVILGFSWIGLFGLRFSLDTTSLVLNRLTIFYSNIIQWCVKVFREVKAIIEQATTEVWTPSPSKTKPTRLTN